MNGKSKLRLIMVVCAGVLMLALLILHTPPVQHYVLGKAGDYLRTNQGIELTAAGFRYNLFRLSVTLTDFSLRSTAARELPPFVRADRAYVRLEFLSLLRRKPIFDSARLEGVQVQIVRNANGRDNLPVSPQTRTSRDPNAPLGFLIADLTAPNGSIQYEDREDNIQIEFPMWSLDIAGDPSTWTQNVEFHTNQAGRATLQERSASFSELNFSTELKPGGITIQQLDLRSEQSRIQVTGSLTDFAEPELNFKVNTSLDTRQLAELAGIQQEIGQEIEGQLDGETSITGSIQDLALTTQQSGTDLSFRNFKQIDFATTAQWNRDRQQIQVNSLAAESPAGTITAEAILSLAQEAGQSSLTASIGNLNLATVTRQLNLPIQLASRAEGRIHAQWNGLQFRQVEGDARLQLLRQRNEPRADLLPVSASLSINARNNRVTVAVASLESLASRWQGNLSLTSLKNLGGQLRAEVDSSGQLLRNLEAFLGRQPGSLPGTKVDGPMDVNLEVRGTINQPQLLANIDAPDTAVGQLNNVVLRAKADYLPQRIAIEDASATWQGQSLVAAGTIGLGQPSPRLDLNARIDGGSFSAILAGLGNDIPVDGTFDVQAAVGGTANNPNAQISIAGAGLTAYGETLGTFSLQSDLANRQIQVTQLDLVQPSAEGGRLTATGRYDIDSQGYTFQTDVQSLKLDRLKLPNNLQVQGTLNVSAGGTGSIPNPSLDARFDVLDLTLGNHVVGNVGATAQVEQHQATVTAQIPRFNIVSHAGIGTEAPYPVRIEVNTDTDLSQLDLTLEDEPLRGHIAAVINGSGNLKEWRKATGSVDIADLKLNLRGQEVENLGSLKIAYEAEEIQVQSATLVSGQSRVGMNGSIPLEPSSAPGSLDVKGSFDLASIFSLLPEQENLSATGVLNLDAMLQGSLKEIDPVIRLTMQEGTFDAPNLNTQVTHINLDLEYRHGVADITQLSANLGPASIRGNGQVPVAPLLANLPIQAFQNTEPAKFTFDVKDLELNTFREVPESVDGTIAFQVEGESSRVNDFGALRARAVFQQLQLKVSDYEIQQTEPVQVSLADGVARIDQFRLTGPTTQFEANGSVNLRGDRKLNLRVDGNLNIGIAALFTQAVQAAGQGRFQLAIGGNLSAPAMSGVFEMQQGEFAIQNPQVAAQNLDVRLEFTPRTIQISKLSGALNGGNLTVSGSLGYDAAGINNLLVDVSASDAFLNIPNGFRTRVSADLTLRSQNEIIVVGGQAHILQGSFRRSVSIGGELTNYLRGGGAVQLAGQRSPFLSRLRFNVSTDTEGPLIIDNNLAKLQAEANLRLTGTYYRPGLVGRLTLDEGGQLYFNERTYLVQTGIISFVNQARIEPDLNIQATTQVSSYDITLHLSGTPENFSADFTSDPSLSKPDIIAVLLTGRRLEELQGSGLNVARQQVESYLSGELAGVLSRGAQESLGLSQVRIEPSLINPETDPGARLTLGQDITNRLRLIYSMNLVNGGDQIYDVQYDVTRRFQTEGTKQSDNSYRFDFRHDVQFGGATSAPATKRTGGQQIGNITFTGSPVFPAEQLGGKLNVQAGDNYDFFKFQKGIDRLRNFYSENGYLEARINATRQEAGSKIDVSIQIEAGPKVEFVYEGFSPSGKLKKQIRNIWQDGLFDAQRTQESADAIQSFLVDRDYLQPKVTYQVSSPAENEKRVAFDINVGNRFRDVPVVFEGASQITPSRLAEVLKDANLETDVYLNSTNVANFLSDYYHQSGYLDAKVGKIRYELNPESKTSRTVVSIEEGSLYRVHALEFQGNNGLTDSQLQNAVPLILGGPYRPELLQSSVSALEETYWTHGYNDVVVDYTLKRASEPGLVDAAFQITENKQQVVERIEIEGNHETSNSLVQSQLELSPGDVLDYQKTNQSRTRLYDTNAYTLVDIQPQSLDRSEANLKGYQEPVALQIKLQEVRPFEVRYGGFYDTDRGPGIIADFSNRNSLGSARLVGLRTRYDSDVHELRGYFSQPFLRRFPVDTNATGFLRREIMTDFITDRTGFSLQQEAQFQNKFILSYGYRFERNHTYDKGPDPFFDITLNTAPLTATLTRDVRNDVLDASRGSFVSQALEYAPSFLGSDLRFMKYYGQYFHYLPLSRPTEVPWTHRTRSRLVYAGAVRVGLSGGFGGQDLIGTDKFFTGGGTTIRGFEQNAVGPKDFLGDPAGGNSVLIINNEIRFPLFSFFDGVGFLDIGNVYPRVLDFNPTDVRKSSGFGLRVRTPYFLLRADYGIKLDRKPGESFGKFFFSIGQAF